METPQRTHGLEHFRDRFAHPDPTLTYLDGNSLGRMPIAAVELAANLVDTGWAHDLIRGWNSGWMNMGERLGDKVAQIIGVPQGTTVIADSTSVNLAKLAQSALTAQKGRSRIVTDDLNFPSDLYILASLAVDGHTLEVVPSIDGRGPAEAIIALLDEDVALVSLSATAYHSGYTYDTKQITDAAHAVGAMVLWDLSHTAGSVPVDLTDADLAVGCCYKYLNGGPGAPAFLYVRQDLQTKLSNPIPGWMSHARLFDFSPDFDADLGIRRFLTGTPPVLSTALIEPGLDIHLEAGSVAVREASLMLTDAFIQGFDDDLLGLGYELQSPRDHARRGSHVTLGHANAFPIDQALINNHNLIPDYRPPNGIRFGFAPLYNGFTDVVTAIGALRDIVITESWKQYEGAKVLVT